jgi:hypothetical protein
MIIFARLFLRRIGPEEMSVKRTSSTTDGGTGMEIGEPRRIYTVEPLEDPVPRATPIEPVKEPTKLPPERAGLPA